MEPTPADIESILTFEKYTKNIDRKEIYDVARAVFVDKKKPKQVMAELGLSRDQYTRRLVRSMQMVERAKSANVEISPESSVDALQLSIRSQNCLESAGIKTVGELLSKSEIELLKTKNFGRKSLHEIVDVLRENGLRMGEMEPGDLKRAIRSRLEMALEVLGDEELKRLYEFLCVL